MPLRFFILTPVLVSSFVNTWISRKANKFSSRLHSKVDVYASATTGIFSQEDWLRAWQTSPEVILFHQITLSDIKIRSKVDYDVEDIEGRIPDDLAGGVLFRAGPGRFDRGISPCTFSTNNAATTLKS